MKILLENIQKDEVFKKKTGLVVWKCRNCGYVITDSEAPKVCPACSHLQSFFEIKADNY